MSVIVSGFQICLTLGGPATEIEESSIIIALFKVDSTDEVKLETGLLDIVEILEDKFEETLFAMGLDLRSEKKNKYNKQYNLKF